MQSALYPRRPLIGVGAVVWDGRSVLLEQRGQPPGEGSWSLPGGLVDVGETAEAAVRREVREECGIEVTVGPLLGVFEPIVRDPDGRVRYHYVVVDYLAYHHGGAVQVGRRCRRSRLGCAGGAGRVCAPACHAADDRTGAGSRAFGRSSVGVQTIYGARRKVTAHQDSTTEAVRGLQVGRRAQRLAHFSVISVPWGGRAVSMAIR